MKTIETVNVWIKGETKIAELFKLKSIDDDLGSSALLYYELLVTTGVDDPYVITNGNLDISGSDYTTWKANANTNEYAYTWAAAQLNLVITTA